MSAPSDWAIELNSFARGIRLERRPGIITAATTPEEMIELSRRWLLSYWKETPDGDLGPSHELAEQSLIPDEVVVRAPDGKALYRRTIMDDCPCVRDSAS